MLLFSLFKAILSSLRKKKAQKGREGEESGYSDDFTLAPRYNPVLQLFYDPRRSVKRVRGRKRGRL